MKRILDSTDNNSNKNLDIIKLIELMRTVKVDPKIEKINTYSISDNNGDRIKL